MENVTFHRHIGSDSPKIEAKDLKNLNTEIQNYLNTLNYVTTNQIPSNAPICITDQIQIYVNGATKRLYIYDFTNELWYYVNLA